MGIKERSERDKRERIEKLRKLILNAALSIAKEKGWNAVTIRNIAHQIEYTPRIIYDIFKSKDEILWQLLIEGNIKLANKIHLVLKDIDNPIKQIPLVINAIIDFVLKNRTYYEVMYYVKEADPFKTYKMPAIDILMDRNYWYEAIQKIKPHLSKEEAIFLFESFQALLHGYITLYLDKRLKCTEKYFRESVVNAIEKYLNTF
ncbi:MAG: hypothetical protein STSR0008_16330 [Ignavibacterium sp.]